MCVDISDLSFSDNQNSDESPSQSLCHACFVYSSVDASVDASCSLSEIWVYEKGEWIKRVNSAMPRRLWWVLISLSLAVEPVGG